MPSDTARENASIAYSIVTDWKNERGNLGGPGNPDAKSIHNSVICVGFVLFCIFFCLSTFYC